MAGVDGVTHDDRTGLRSSLVFVLSVVASNRELRRVELAFVTFNCGEWAAWLAMLVYAYAQGGVTESGIVATVVLIPAAAFAPVMAAVGERHAPGNALVAGYLAQALSCAVVSVALFAEAPSLVVYALFVGPSIAFTMTRPTQSSFAPALARTPEELTASNVASGWVESVGTLVAPALAGAVLAVGSEAMVYGLVAIGCLVGAVLVLPLRSVTPAPALEGADDGSDARLVGALEFVRRDPQAALLVLLLAAQGIAFGALDVLNVELAQGVLGRGGDWAGYLSAAFGAGSVVAIVVTARLVGLTRLALPLVLSIGVWSAAFMGLATLPGALGALVLIAVAGSARTTFDVAGRTLLQRVARPDLLARVFGLLEGLLMAAFAVGSLLAPLLVAIGGVPLAFVSVGAILPLVAIVARPATSRHRSSCHRSRRRDRAAPLDATLRAASSADARVARTRSRTPPRAGWSRRHQGRRRGRSLLRHRRRRGRDHSRRTSGCETSSRRGVRRDRSHLRRASHRDGHDHARHAALHARP